jgi:hypothetical protein
MNAQTVTLTPDATTKAGSITWTCAIAVTRPATSTCLLSAVTNRLSAASIQVDAYCSTLKTALSGGFLFFALQMPSPRAPHKTISAHASNFVRSSAINRSDSRSVRPRGERQPCVSASTYRLVPLR